MDQTAAQWMGASPSARNSRSTASRWMRIRYRAARVRRSARRARRAGGDEWLDRVSPWAFWGLHR